MRGGTLIALALAAIALAGAGGPPAATAPGRAVPARFRTVDITLDGGDSALAAYQVEVVLTAPEGPVALVGVEGGDGAYSEAPYYDPAALHDQGTGPERIVLAAFTAAGATAPRGAVRVARLHLFVERGADPTATVRVLAAGADEKTRINAEARTTLLAPPGTPDDPTTGDD